MESSAPHLAHPTEPSPGGPSSAPPADQPEALEAALGYRFTHRELLCQALTHSSLAHEQLTHEQPKNHAAHSRTTAADNERLEFLGDAVVGLVAAESLYRRYPELAEGDLTRLRGTLVSRKHLGEVGRRLQIGRYLLLGRGEQRSGGRSNAALLANAVEALLGAIYLDAGVAVVQGLIEEHIIGPSVDLLRKRLRAAEATGDYKSALQEKLQAAGQGEPEYRVSAETGPPHRRKFFVDVSSAGSVIGAGSGRSKKAAEQDAARQALASLREDA